MFIIELVEKETGSVVKTYARDGVPKDIADTIASMVKRNLSKSMVVRIREKGR